jgi:hypothetical protein
MVERVGCLLEAVGRIEPLALGNDKSAADDAPTTL